MIPPSAPRQRGVTMIELMIALLIGLFLTAGLVTLVSAMKNAGIAQDGMTKLQDDERLAMTLMTDVIQSAGYFPDPHTGLTVAMPARVLYGLTWFPGQSVLGTGTFPAAAPGDRLIVRYKTTGSLVIPSDNVLNCVGATTPKPSTFVNEFSIDASGNLQCVLTIIDDATGIAAPPVTTTLISNVKNLQVTFGIKTGAFSGASADSYLDASQVNLLPQDATTSGWSQVMSVRVKLTFVNPLTNPATTIDFSRFVDVNNLVGVR